jgi:hypothetical protein
VRGCTKDFAAHVKSLGHARPREAVTVSTNALRAAVKVHLHPTHASMTPSAASIAVDRTPAAINSRILRVCRPSTVMPGAGANRQYVRGAANCARSSSSLAVIALIAAAEKLWPHSSSLIALTFRVDTPCTYISARPPTKAFSLR